MKYTAFVLLLAGSLLGCGRAPHPQAPYPAKEEVYADDLVSKEWATAGITRYVDKRARVVCYQSAVGLSCLPLKDTTILVVK